ncbi:MAG: DegV family protein [Chitinophagales bacterium]
MGVKVLTDSTSYILPELARDLDITVIPLSVQFPDESFKETEVDFNYFYAKIKKDNVIPVSSQPSLGDITTAFENIVAKGDDVVAVFISSEMSGTYHSALTAKQIILEKYPHAAIEIIDSRTNCMALGLPVIEAARIAKAGHSLENVAEKAKHIIQRVNFCFIPAGLEYLRKGGRIGGAAALLGSILKITPILFVEKGKTAVLKKARGYRTALEDMLARVDKDFINCGLNHVVVHHIQCHARGMELAERLKEKYGFEVPVVPIGPVIGLHVGPGAIGIVYSTV